MANNVENKNANQLVPEDDVINSTKIGNHTVIETEDFVYAYPDNIDSETNETLLLHGDGGKAGGNGGLRYMLDNNGEGIYNYLEDNDVNSVLVMPKGSLHHEEVDNYIEEVNRVHEQLGLQSDEKSVIGYSNGCYFVTDSAEKLIDTNDTLPPLKLTMIDPDTTYMREPKDTTVDTLSANGARLTLFEKDGELHSNRGEFHRYYDKYSNAGMDVDFIGGSQDHGRQFHDAVKDGLLTSYGASDSKTEESTRSLLASRSEIGRRMLTLKDGEYQDLNIDDSVARIGATTASAPIASPYAPITPTVQVSSSDIIVNAKSSIGGLPSKENLTLNKAELDAFLNSSALAALTTDTTDASNLKSLIAGFKNNGVLVGDVWNLAYDKLDQYDSALSERAEAANELGTAIRNAITELQECMDKYSVMDTSELPEIETELENLKTQRDQLAASQWYENDDGEIVEDTTVTEALTAIDNNITEVNEYVTAMKTVQETYDKVVKDIETAMEKVQKFSTAVANITPSQKYVFVG